jgi:rfaE bifunctional protein nucleotidyltransferase chain/domain
LFVAVGHAPRSRELGRAVSQGDLILHRREWKRNGQRVVFASGGFELLHPGHIRLLEQGRSLGDILVVGIQSDRSFRKDPGKNSTTDARSRPITPAAERSEILAALAAVDYVAEFDEPSPRDLLASLGPDIVVTSDTPGSKDFAFREDVEVEAAGGKVVRVPLEPGYSTTGLIERITQLRA